MKRIRVFLILCSVVLFTAVSAAAAAERVGFINLQRLVNESKMGQAAREDLSKLRREKEKILAEKIKAFNALKEKVNQGGAKMDIRQRRDKNTELQKLYREIQRLVADAKDDITREDRELVAIILQKADGVLKKIAKKKGFAIILKDPNAIGYLNPDVDITDSVLAELNKKK